jgi:hypothetical protein
MSTQRIFPWTAGVVVPGASVDLSVTLVAPSQGSSYQSNFMLLAPNGTVFGLGARNSAFWTKIVVPTIITITPVTLTPPVITITPDWQGPNSPQLLSPEDKRFFTCSVTRYITLAWNAASDPSGISQYELIVELSVYGQPWNPVEKGTVPTNQLTRNINPKCNYEYRWRVRARDGGGNWGPYGDYLTFYVMEPTP